MDNINKSQIYTAPVLPVGVGCWSCDQNKKIKKCNSPHFWFDDNSLIESLSNTSKRFFIQSVTKQVLSHYLREISIWNEKKLEWRVDVVNIFL